MADRGNPRLKLLDRWVGVPAVAVVGAARRLRGRRPLPKEWKTIGLVRTAAIGDTILMSGVVRDLRAARPDARIVMFVSATNAGFARLLPEPDEVVVLPIRNVPKAVRLVRAQRADVVIDFGAWPRLDALFASLSGAGYIAGRRTPGQYRHYGFDAVVDHSSVSHEVETFRRLLAVTGIESTSDPSLEAATDPERTAAPFVVFHLWPGGANAEERSWDLAKWRELAGAVGAQGYRISLTGGPGDHRATAAIVDEWRAAGLEVDNAAGTTPAEALALVRRARGVISVNTGLLHLAAAAGTPTIALNGPTSGRRWGPVGARTRSVASPRAPHGYLDLGFERNDQLRDCMQDISVAAVLDAWQDLVARDDPS